MADYKFQTDIPTEIIELLMLLEEALDRFDDSVFDPNLVATIKQTLDTYYHDDYLAEQVLVQKRRDEYNKEQEKIFQSGMSSQDMMDMLQLLMCSKSVDETNKVTEVESGELHDS